MGLKEDLEKEVKQTLAGGWDEQEAARVPEPEDLRLNANHAKSFKTGTVLYADLDGSTSMVDTYPWHFSAEIYKAYLRCAAAIVRKEGGTITAYDGDRVMAVFMGDYMNTSAVQAALTINSAVEDIIRPAVKIQYPAKAFLLKHVIGIDTSALHAARIGVHGDNDLVWIGRAANYAAKLCTLSAKPIWITKAVYDRMHESVKFSNGVNMWTAHQWTVMNEMAIFASTYRQTF